MVDDVNRKWAGMEWSVGREARQTAPSLPPSGQLLYIVTELMHAYHTKMYLEKTVLYFEPPIEPFSLTLYALEHVENISRSFEKGKFFFAFLRMCLSFCPATLVSSL